MAMCNSPHMRVLSRLGLLAAAFAVLGGWGGGARGQGEFPLPGTPQITAQWSMEELSHEPEARALFQHNGYVYIGMDGPEGRIAKVRVADGRTAWSIPTHQSYQPSYPVSNGKVVVAGSYYAHAIVGLDDRNGKPLWKVPTSFYGTNIMGSACFDEELVYIADYRGTLIAIQWADGKVRWQAELDSPVWATPSVWQGQVLIGAYDGRLYALDKKTGRQVQAYDGDGMINSSSVVVRDLAFQLVRNEKWSEPGPPPPGSRLLVVDLKARKTVATFPIDDVHRQRLVAHGDDVYFWDARGLFAYNAARRKLDWTYPVLRGMRPYPWVFKRTVVLAVNSAGYHVEPTTHVVVLDRKTGRELWRRDKGGVALDRPHYSQVGNQVITAHGAIRAYHVAAE